MKLCMCWNILPLDEGSKLAKKPQNIYIYPENVRQLQKTCKKKIIVTKIWEFCELIKHNFSIHINTQPRTYDKLQ